MIDLERYRKIDEIFQAALELDPRERPAYIGQACGGDESLVKEVEYLLASDQQQWELLGTSAFEMVAPLLTKDHPELNAGESIGHYHILSLLGVGGMGHVYLAEDQKLGRKVALKLLPASCTRDASRLRRFQQEARAASALNHPNILTIHELGEVDGQKFIATEFVEGETLREVMKRAPLTFAQTIDIGIQIAGVLATAHKAGIVHRDIKPEDIMLRHDGYVKVLDFGLAKLTEQSEAAIQMHGAADVNISSGLVMGTVKYMSPEQARGQQVDQRSDNFSVGVVLYEMLTGDAPFKGETTSDLVRSILKDEPHPLTEYRSDAPEELQRIVTKLLTRNKTKRYQTAEDSLVDLKTLRQHLGPSASGSVVPRADGPTAATADYGTRTATTIEYFVTQIREHKPIATVGLVAIIILVAGVSYPLRKWVGKRAAPARELKTTMLTTTGHAMDPAISPDGKYVAYRAEEADLVSLRIRELATNNEREITPPGDRFVFDPVFSPDGKYLYYESIADDPPPDYPGRGYFKNYWRQLYRRPVAGGPAEKIVDYLTSTITFSPDGREFAFIRLNLREGVGALVIANVDDTNEREIISRKAPNYFEDFYSFGLSWAPDGKHIIYVAKDAGDGYDRIFELNLETNVERPLTSQKWGHGLGNVTWLPDSSGILFNAANTSISNALWRLSYPGGEEQRITNDAGKYMAMSVANDSDTLITAQVADYIELWMASDADASRARRIMPGRHDGRYGLAWTPDRKIVFTRETSDNSDIWIANADGTNQKQLTTDVHQDQEPAVTSDGRYIVFQSNRIGGDHIWRMDIDGSNQKQLTFGKVEREPSCSPDSKWIVYTAWETGKPTPWKIPVEGGTPQRITDVSCVYPRISHNGKLMACEIGRQVLIFSFETGQRVTTVEPPQGAYWDGSWTLDDGAIRYGMSSREANWGLYGTFNWWVQPINGGPPEQLTFFKANQPGATSTMKSAWSPDGKDLLYSHFELKSDLVMMSGLK